jgi:hypothetical protein
MVDGQQGAKPDDTRSYVEVQPRPSALEKAVERSTIHIDAAACIKWTFLGLAILVIVIASVRAGSHDLAAGLVAIVAKL